MSRRPVTFRQSDVTRALRAAEKAGVAARAVEIDPSGRIIIRIGEPEAAAPAPATDFDKWMARRGSR